MARIGNEEAVLPRDLPGYEEYVQRVRYQLLPRVWWLPVLGRRTLVLGMLRLVTQGLG